MVYSSEEEEEVRMAVGQFGNALDEAGDVAGMD